MNLTSRPVMIVLGLVVAGTVTGGSYFMLRDGTPVQQEPTGDQSGFREATIERGDLRETVSVAARVEAQEQSDLSFMSSGVVVAVNVQPGDTVQQGDVLMSLDTTQLELDIVDAQIALELQQIQRQQLEEGPSNSDIASARAAVQQAQGQLDQVAAPTSDEAVRLAQAQLQMRESERAIAYQNWTNAINQHGDQSVEANIAQKQAEAAELAVQIATLDLANAQQGAPDSDIAASQAQVRQAQATLSRLLEGPNDIDLQLADLAVEQARLSLENAQAALADAQITAPYDGLVTAVNLEAGEQATAGMPAVRVLDTSDYTVVVSVDEIDIVRLREGQLVFVELDAYPNAELTGTVSSVSPVGLSVAGVTTYEVRVDLDETDVPIRDGMTATVEIVVSELTDVLLVPNWVVNFDRTTGQSYVNVVRDDGTIEQVEVELGVRGASMSEVRSGLREGDTVVVSLEREGFDVFGDDGS